MGRSRQGELAGRLAVAWGMGWDIPSGVVVAGSLQVTPGDPMGIDTNAAGALSIGGTNATSVNLDPPTTIDNTFAATGDVTLGAHLLSTAAGPLVSSTLGANVTSVTPAGNDVRGTLTIVMAGTLAANTKVCTLTFAVSYGATSPKVTLVDQTSGAGLAVVNSYVLAQSTGVSFDIAFDSALALGTYIIDYIVIG